MFLFYSLVIPAKLVELIRRDYKGAVLCPFPWCEDELQLKLSNIFTRLQIVSRTKERSQLTGYTVNMTEIFKSHPECHNPRVVLIEGNPGMGKTTYCQKLAHDWSVGAIPSDASFPKVEILLLLKCRDMHMKTANVEEAIDDQLLPQDAGKKEKEGFFHFIRSNQSKILLILDGLDELPQELLPCIQPLIQGKIFSNTFLVLTARHEAGIGLRRYCDTLLEIIGYTNDNVDSYIKKYFSKHEDQSLAEKMIQQLKSNKELRELTANPLNTALLCLLCEETKGIFPSSRTKIYDDLVSCALRRYFTKRGVPLSDDDPLERCADELNQLGETAFEALLKNQLYFSRDDRTRESTDFLQLPFLSRELSVSKIRPKPCYAFSHKTFQEYFAAFYLAQQTITGNEREAKSLLAQLSPVDNWQVWEFLLTMVSSKRSEMAVFVVSRLCAFFYQEGSRSTIGASEHSDISCDIEFCERKTDDWTRNIEKRSEDEEVLEDVVTKTLHLIKDCKGDNNELSDIQRKMVHVLARCFPVRKLGLFVTNHCHVVYCEYLKANCSLIELSLNSDEFDESLFATIEGALHREQTLTHLNLRCENFELRCIKMRARNHAGGLFPEAREVNYGEIANVLERQSWAKDFFSEALARLIQTYSLLTHLNLTGVFLCCEGAAALAEVIRTSHTLTHLSLRNAAISDLGAINIAHALQSNCTLTHLILGQNLINDLGATALACCLRKNRTLQYVDLSVNHGGDSVAQKLAVALECNCSLTCLDLSHLYEDPTRSILSEDSGKIRYIQVRRESIGPSGALSLARVFRLNRTLTSLDLTYNKIGDLGAATLGEALQSNCCLNQIYLCGNAIGAFGAACLGKGLKSNHTLTRLCLTENVIGDQGAEALGNGLRSNGKLTHLDLQSNHIGVLGATAFAKALESTGTQLSFLDMSLNNIGASGARALAKALESNTSLRGLNCGCNDIGTSGASFFATALRSNRTLTHLLVECNGIADSGAAELSDALLINKRLSCLNVEYNPIGPLGVENLRRVKPNCVILM